MNEEEYIYLSPKYYRILLSTVTTTPYKLATTIPTFLINEAISFFEKKEEFENCAILKNFFDRNPFRKYKISREEYMEKGWEVV